MPSNIRLCQTGSFCISVAGDRNSAHFAHFESFAPSKLFGRQSLIPTPLFPSFEIRRNCILMGMKSNQWKPSQQLRPALAAADASRALTCPEYRPFGYISDGKVREMKIYLFKKSEG